MQIKKINRKHLRFNQSKKLGFIKKNVDIAFAAKLQKKTEFEKKRTNRNFMKMWRMKRNEMHVKKITVRKQEKLRIKQIKKLKKQWAFISIEMLQPIADSEAE